ncbi:hypothetical protein GGH99_005946 [Coemansia sp. RSA 1285]|nr:hypothetical protein EV177_003686 [Coemansia sp. RSA 1804]KAJ2674986.1 hypothetical protein GGH99_005946 [Coemansia sp. RSA 1285]
MNFFRRRPRRGNLVTDAADPDTHSLYISTPEKDYIVSGKQKRQSYFSLRWRETTDADTVSPPPTAVVKKVALSRGDGSGTSDKHILRKRLSRNLHGESKIGGKPLKQRSIPGISYLINKRSEAKLGNIDNALLAVGGQEGVGMEQQQQQHQKQREDEQHQQEQQQGIDEDRTSESSGDESSGGESDDTLATQNCDIETPAEYGADPTNSNNNNNNDSGSTAASLSAGERSGAAASDLQAFPSLATAAGGNGSSAGSLDRAQCGASDGMARKCKATDAAKPCSAGLEGHKNDDATLPKSTRHRRRSLLLRMESPTTPSHLESSVATVAADSGSKELLGRRRQLKLGRLGAGRQVQEPQNSERKPHWHQQLVQRRVASAVRSTFAGIHSSAERGKTNGILALPARMLTGAGNNDNGSSSSGSGDDEPKHRLRIKTHSRAQSVMSKKRSGNGLGRLFHPPPPTAAEQARMDAWTEDDDDFATSEYDLTGVLFELPTASLLAAELRPTARKSDDGAKGSRLSSTSTVVDDSALSAEQSKRLYCASAHKLQWPANRRRGMAALLHIRNAMARANEHYIVASGGRRLSGLTTVHAMVAELCARDDRFYEGAVVARAQSRLRRIASAAAVVSDRELIGFGSGDLVSLDAADAGSGSGAAAGGARYRRPRRHRASRRWRMSQGCSVGAGGCVAAAISAGGMS